MQYRQLGNSGLRVSQVGLGGNVFGPPRLDLEGSMRNIHRAQELGVNFIDTAYFYNDGKSEEFIGKAIADRRDAFVIATKFHFFQMGEDESPEQRIRQQCETSLQRLGVDCIDLYQIHFPDDRIAPERILETLAALRREGKIRHAGQCNYAAWRHMEALGVAQAADLPKMVTAQNQYNVLRRQVELELLPFCRARDIGFLPYFPLAGGFLSGKYRPGEAPLPGTRGAAGSGVVRRNRNQRNETLVEELTTYAADHGRSLLELAVAWLLADPVVSSVIAGAMNSTQIEQNVAAADWNLAAEEKAQIDAIAVWDGSEELIEPTLEYFR